MAEDRPDHGKGLMNSKYLKLIVFALLFLIPKISFGLDVPYLHGHVTDLTNTLNESTQTAITNRLKRFVKSTSNQIAVLIIPSLENENLEEYSLRVAETWKLGQKDKDNGVLLLIVKNDRKLRIEVGYGLESKLTDALASQIINQEIVPLFKRGKFNQGVTKGVHSIIGAIKGFYKRKPINKFRSKIKNAPWLAYIVGGFFWILFIYIFAVSGLASDRHVGFVLNLAFLSLFLYAIPVLLGFVGWILFSIILFSYISFRIYLLVSKNGQDIHFALGNPLTSTNSYWYSGLGHYTSTSSNYYSYGSSGSSSGSSGGGFSGGGGSFGGGGSSGSW